MAIKLHRKLYLTIFISLCQPYSQVIKLYENRVHHKECDCDFNFFNFCKTACIKFTNQKRQKKNKQPYCTSMHPRLGLL